MMLKIFVLVFSFVIFPFTTLGQKKQCIKLINFNFETLKNTKIWINSNEKQIELEPKVNKNETLIEFEISDIFADLEVIYSQKDSILLEKRYLVKNSNSTKLTLNFKNGEIFPSKDFIDFYKFTRDVASYSSSEFKKSQTLHLALRNAEIDFDSLQIIRKNIENAKDIWFYKQLEFLRKNPKKLESLVQLDIIVHRQKFIKNNSFQETLNELDVEFRNSKFAKNLSIKIENKALRFNNAPLIGRKYNIKNDFIDLEGNKISFNDFSGKTIILNFWNTSCKPCIAEIPYLKQIDDKFPEIIILGLSDDRNSTYLKKIIEANNISWPQIQINQIDLSEFNITAIPTTIIIDKNGNFKNIHIGFLDFISLSKMIEN